MAYKIVVTEAAHEDLDSTFGYIAERLSNPTAAVRLLEQVEECYGKLKSFPLMYEACRDARLHSLGYRKAVIGNFVLVYRPVEAEKTVYVLRFFYGGRDYEKLL